MKQTDIRSFLQFIWNIDTDDRPACQLCQAELHAYIDIELDKEDAATIYPEIAQHLLGCQECKQAYEELKTLLQRERRGTLNQPSIEPIFDFSYLDDVPKIQIWKRVDLAGQQVMQFFTEIRVLVGSKMASFGSLPSPLKPAFTPVMASRDKTTDTDERSQILHAPPDDTGLPFSLTIGHVSEGKSTLNVQIRASSSQLIDKARVTLRDKEHRILESVRVDEDKEATFDKIDPGDYLVEVKYQGQPWILSITFTPAAEESSATD